MRVTKKLAPISGKVNKGDEIKKSCTFFEQVDQGAEKNNQNKNIAGISLEMNRVFFQKLAIILLGMLFDNVMR